MIGLNSGLVLILRLINRIFYSTVIAIVVLNFENKQQHFTIEQINTEHSTLTNIKSTRFVNETE